MKYKIYYGFEDDFEVEGNTIEQIKDNANRIIDEKGLRKNYQGMGLYECMMEYIGD